MALCDVCGNDYPKSFTIVMSGQEYTFDSFECAIQMLAPVCSHCQCRVIGHGIERNGSMFCCEHCSRCEQAAPEESAAS